MSGMWDGDVREILKRYHNVIVTGFLVAFVVSLFFRSLWLSMAILLVAVPLARSPREAEEKAAAMKAFQKERGSKKR